MPAEAKVGQRLDKANDQQDEAYELSSDSEPSVSSGPGGMDKSNGSAQNHQDDEEDDEDDDDEETEDERQEKDEELDWESLIPRIRLATLDKSKQRRQAFVSRYLTVSDSCEFQLGPHIRQSSDIDIAPPLGHVPAIFTALLSALMLVSIPDHVDLIVRVLMDLVKRDDKLAGDKLKLGDKLVRWLMTELDKTVSLSNS